MDQDLIVLNRAAAYVTLTNFPVFQCTCSLPQVARLLGLINSFFGSFLNGVRGLSCLLGEGAAE